MQKMDYVRELLKQMLKTNKACCCAKDGSFECRNCKLVESMEAPREFACMNCFEVKA